MAVVVDQLPNSLAGWLALIRFHTCLKCAEANECLYEVN